MVTNTYHYTHYDTFHHSVIPRLKEAFKFLEAMNITPEEWRDMDPQDRHYFNMVVHGIQTATENAEDFCRGQDRETNKTNV